MRLLTSAALIAAVSADALVTTSFTSKNCAAGTEVQRAFRGSQCLNGEITVCENTYAYHITKFAGSDCTGAATPGPSIALPVPPARESCLGVGGDSTQQNTSWVSQSCQAGWTPSSARSGVTLAQYNFLPANTSCPLPAALRADVYYDILPTCQLYPAGADDNEYNYLSFQYSCVSGKPQSTYYTGAFCSGSPIVYPDQECEVYAPSFFVFGCPPATGLSGGAIAGIAIASSAVGILGLAALFVPSFRAGVAGIFTSNPLWGKKAGASTYESMPLASGKA